MELAVCARYLSAPGGTEWRSDQSRGGQNLSRALSLSYPHVGGGALDSRETFPHVSEPVNQRGPCCWPLPLRRRSALCAASEHRRSEEERGRNESRSWTRTSDARRGGRCVLPTIRRGGSSADTIGAWATRTLCLAHPHESVPGDGVEYRNTGEVAVRRGRNTREGLQLLAVSARAHIGRAREHALIRRDIEPLGW